MASNSTEASSVEATPQQRVFALHTVLPPLRAPPGHAPEPNGVEHTETSRAPTSRASRTQTPPPQSADPSPSATGRAYDTEPEESGDFMAAADPFQHHPENGRANTAEEHTIAVAAAELKRLGVSVPTPTASHNAAPQSQARSDAKAEAQPGRSFLELPPGFQLRFYACDRQGRRLPDSVSGCCTLRCVEHISTLIFFNQHTFPGTPFKTCRG